MAWGQNEGRGASSAGSFLEPPQDLPVSVVPHQFPQSRIPSSERTRLWRLRQAIDLSSWIALFGPQAIVDPSSPDAAPSEALLLAWEREFGLFPGAGSPQTRLSTWTNALKKAFQAAGEPFSLFQSLRRCQALGQQPPKEHVFFPIRIPDNPGFREEWDRLLGSPSPSVVSAPSCVTRKRGRSPPHANCLPTARKRARSPCRREVHDRHDIPPPHGALARVRWAMGQLAKAETVCLLTLLSPFSFLVLQAALNWGIHPSNIAQKKQPIWDGAQSQRRQCAWTCDRWKRNACPGRGATGPFLSPI